MAKSEVESARSQFEHERETILDYLREILRAALPAAKLKTIADPVREGGWDNWWPSGAFFKFRRDSGNRSKPASRGPVKGGQSFQDRSMCKQNLVAWDPSRDGG